MIFCLWVPPRVEQEGGLMQTHLSVASHRRGPAWDLHEDDGPISSVHAARSTARLRDRVARAGRSCSRDRRDTCVGRRRGAVCR